MNGKINVLVTGCGGDIGQSVGKILNEFDFINMLYGCDISDKNAAKFIFSNFFIGIPCSHPTYITNLEKVVEEKNIDFIIPIAEPELRFFSKQSVFQIGKAKLITASSMALEVGFDKFKTVEFLKKNHLPYPVTQLIESVETIDQFPVVIKSRTGSGSSSVHIVKDAFSFQMLKANNSGYIVQEFLEEKNGEYTCGVYRSSNGDVRIIIFKRELLGGFTGYGEVIENKDIEKILIEIAIRLELIGSINVQLRLTDKGPVVFEINPRFSSTVRFRDLFGFKDVLWSIEDKLQLPVSEYQANSTGKKLFKGFNEYIQ